MLTSNLLWTVAVTTRCRDRRTLTCRTPGAHFGVRGGGWAITHPFDVAVSAYQSGGGWPVASPGTSRGEKEEAMTMPHVFGPARQGRFRFTLNSDGRPHTVENAL